MPFYYDLERTSTSSTAAATETAPHLSVRSPSNTESLAILGCFASARFGTVGGASFRLKENTSTVTGASGGTGHTPAPKNRRGPAAGSTWNDDASAITAGGTLNVRLSVGFAQTGGMGGYVPLVPPQAVQLLPGSTTNNNPADLEWTSIAASTGVAFDWTVDFQEGI